MSFDGRIGTAFHKVLESLHDDPPSTTDRRAVATEARRRFETELAKQQSIADERPRERGLPRDQYRIHKALESLIVAAQRDVACRGALPGADSDRRIVVKGEGDYELLSDRVISEASTEAEVEVRSTDGLFRGFVDQVEHLPEGARIVDFKSALRDDLPERYARQVQVYALMWRDTRGEWPAKAEVVYPFTGAIYDVPIDPDICEALGDESRALIEQVEQEPSAYRLGAPGDVCKVCDFRPWCRAFWDWQGSERTPSVVMDRAYRGFEGTIESLERDGQVWVVLVAWRDKVVRIVAPEERFPQLCQAQTGMTIRILEMRLQGMLSRPVARVNECSEIWLVTASEGGKHV